MNSQLRQSSLLFYVLLSLALLSACSNAANDTQGKNGVPTAVAGEKQTVAKRATVLLDGSNSHDPENNKLNFAWAQLSGVPVDLKNATTPKAEFIAPSQQGVLRFGLTVKDTLGQASEESVVEIAVINHTPVANAGADRKIPANINFNLDAGLSSDEDQDPLTYVWTYLGTNPEITLVDQTAKIIQLLAPATTGEVLSFKLKVTDTEDEFNEATINLTVSTGFPVADPGKIIEPVLLGSDITLDGTASYDPEGQPIQFQWRQVMGSAVAMEKSATATPLVHIPQNYTDNFIQFELIVSDGELESIPAYVGLSVLEYTGKNIQFENNPFLSNIQLPVRQSITDMQISGSLAYTVDFDFGLRIVDIADPLHFKEIGTYGKDQTNYTGVKLIGNTAFLSKTNTGLELVDISSTTSPTFSKSVAVPGGIYNLEIVGTNGVLANDYKGYTVIDLTDPSSPAVNKSFRPVDQPSGGRTMQVIHRNGVIYEADYTNISIISISNGDSLDSPKLLGSYVPATQYAYVSRIALEGDFLYAPVQREGVLVFDISSGKPSLVGSYANVSTFVCGIAVKGTTAYIGDSDGLYVVDFSNLANPQLINKYEPIS